MSDTQENSEIEITEAKSDQIELNQAQLDASISQNESSNQATDLSYVETKEYATTTTASGEMSLKEKMYEIIFEADTVGGKAFDISLLVFILGSVVVVMLDSVKSLSIEHDDLFHALEWGFTIIFTIEYVLRLYCSPNRFRYATSFFWNYRFYSHPADLHRNISFWCTVHNDSSYSETT